MHNGSGWGSQGGSQGAPAGGSNLDGWDDMDPMAMLSQSVQSRARAQDSDSAESPQQLTVQAEVTQQTLPAEQLGPQASQDNQTESARNTNSMQSQRTPSIQEYKPRSTESHTASQSKASDLDHLHTGVGMQQLHLAGHDILDQDHTSGLTSQAASAEQESAASSDVVHNSSSWEHEGSHHGTTSKALQDVNAHQEGACHADSVAHPSDVDGSVHVEAAALTAESSLADVQSILGQGDRAVIHIRSPSRDAFGPTLAYGYPGVVFEATQAGRIATVTLFVA